jgi:hypothetical protein
MKALVGGVNQRSNITNTMLAATAAAVVLPRKVNVDLNHRREFPDLCLATLFISSIGLINLYGTLVYPNCGYISIPSWSEITDTDSMEAEMPIVVCVYPDWLYDCGSLATGRKDPVQWFGRTMV